MTRDEFMKIAKDEIESVLNTQRGRLLNLVERAWAEGKKNAETTKVADIIEEALKQVERRTNVPITPVQPYPINVPDPILVPPYIFTCEEPPTVQLNNGTEDDGK